MHPALLPAASLRIVAIAFAGVVALSSWLPQAIVAQEAECTYTDRDAPCALANGSVISGYISEQGGRGYFWFGAPAPNTRAHIELTDLPADYDLYLFNSTDPEPMVSSINDGLTPEVIDVTLQDVGVYFIYVVSDPSLPFNADEPYTLTLKLVFPEPMAQVVSSPPPASAPASAPANSNLIAVPPLVARTSDAAGGIVRDAGLMPTVRVVDRFAERGAGTVASQEPAAGTRLQPGSEVVIYIATGNIQIPSVVSRPELEAESILHEAGVQTETIRRTSDAVPHGIAIDTDPPADTLVPSGTRVRLFISQGR